jgi:hypothetical protein
MDGYIKSSDGKAIIIENKINWAKDQQNQIDRYIQTAIKDGVSKNKIYVIYLTADGTKKVSDESFSTEKNNLDYVNEDNTGRFIELNYQDDILLLLTTTLRQLSFDKESILVSAICQYIDYIEGRFGIRKSEKEYNMAMNESLIGILNLSGSNEEKFEQIEKLQQELWQRLESLKFEIYPNQPNHIANQLKVFFSQNLSGSAPFKFYMLYQGTAVLFRVWSLPLSSQKDKYFAVDIGIMSDRKFSFNIHIIKGKGEWVDADIFKKCLIKKKTLKAYLENNKDFINYEDSYERIGKYNEITDLQNKIVKQFKEISKYLV